MCMIFYTVMINLYFYKHYQMGSDLINNKNLHLLLKYILKIFLSSFLFLDYLSFRFEMRLLRPKQRVSKANSEKDLMSFCSEEFKEYKCGNQLLKV